jgi:hypothetical protein
MEEDVSMSIINGPKKPPRRMRRMSSLLVLPGTRRTRKHTDSLARLAARALRVVPKLDRQTPTA